MTITEKKVEKLLKVVDNYAVDGCYKASERQLFCTYEAILSDLAKEKDLSLDRAQSYQRMAQMVQGR